MRTWQIKWTIANRTAPCSTAHGLLHVPFLLLACVFLAFSSPYTMSDAVASEVPVYNSASLHSALLDAQPGDDIVLYPGDYRGIKTEAPEDRWHYFYSDRSGSSSAPITLRSYSRNDLQVLYGDRVNGSGYIFYLTGNYWRIKDLKFHTGQKGIMLDSASHNVLDNIAVYNVRDEGVHFRQSSSNNVLSNCLIYNTGRLKPGFGEAVYVGTHLGDQLGDNSNGNRIGGCEFGPGVTAEAIDIKAGTVDTIVEHNNMSAQGLSGENYADSFIDVKGDDVIVRYNRMHWQGNGFMDHGIHMLKRDHRNSNIYENKVTLGDGMAFLKIGRGTVHAENNQLSYNGPLASFYSSGAIDSTLENNLPEVYSYTGFQGNETEHTDPDPKTCLSINRNRKTEINTNTFGCIDLPMDASGRLVQVWDSNKNTSCNFRGQLVGVRSGVETGASLPVNGNYAGSRDLSGDRIRIEASNGCPYLMVRWL